MRRERQSFVNPLVLLDLYKPVTDASVNSIYVDGCVAVCSIQSKSASKGRFVVSRTLLKGALLLSAKDHDQGCRQLQQEQVSYPILCGKGSRCKDALLSISLLEKLRWSIFRFVVCVICTNRMSITWMRRPLDTWLVADMQFL